MKTERPALLVRVMAMVKDAQRGKIVYVKWAHEFGMRSWTEFLDV
jgi:hypothetical protein